MDFGYEGRAVFPFTLSASQELAFGDAKLKAHVQWLVCRELGLSGKVYLGLDLKVAPQAPEETNKLIEAAVNAEPVKIPSSAVVGPVATSPDVDAMLR
jgi:DsbC/DsbD-like thiol-disulfide interchange protein